ncbi:MAG: DMT family transporter [Pirellulaceae bacterium]|nr:DMT family transporter [Pirellulaceae bacterium]
MDTKLAPQPMGLRSVALALLTVTLWGGNPVAVQYCLDTLPPIAIAGVRFAIAAVFMWGWCVFSGEPILLRRKQWGPAFVTGVLLFAQISLFNLGVARTNSSHSTLCINTFIIWVVLIDHFITRGDRLGFVKTAGLLSAVTGAVLTLATVTGGGPAADLELDPTTLAGDVLLLASALVLAIKVVYTKYAVREISPGSLILWHDVVGVSLFFMASAAFEEVDWARVDGAAVWGLAYQGLLVAGLCFVVQAMLLKRHSASQVSVFSFATPLVGVLLGVTMRGDGLSWTLMLSGVLIAIGILMVQKTAEPAVPAVRSDARQENSIR